MIASQSALGAEALLTVFAEEEELFGLLLLVRHALALVDLLVLPVGAAHGSGSNTSCLFESGLGLGCIDNQSRAAARYSYRWRGILPIFSDVVGVAGLDYKG